MSFWLKAVNYMFLGLFCWFFYRFLKMRFKYNLLRFTDGYAFLEKGLQKAGQESLKLENNNSLLKNELEETIALYDLAKQMRKTFDPGVLFNSFCDYLSRYLGIKTCKFLKDDAELDAYGGFSVIPIEIKNRFLGFLVTDKFKPELNDKFQILFGQFIMGLKRSKLYDEVNELAINDSLTGLLSRRYFMEKAKEQAERSRKFKHSFSFLIIDVDHFKQVNDCYGHFVGDAVLKEVARSIRTNIRQVDLSARYGGDEFAVILDEAGQPEAQLTAERIRVSIGSGSLKAYDEELKVTVSIGIAVFPAHARDLAALISRADQALYRAKEEGRNRAKPYS